MHREALRPSLCLSPGESPKVVDWSIHTRSQRAGLQLPGDRAVRDRRSSTLAPAWLAPARTSYLRLCACCVAYHVLAIATLAPAACVELISSAALCCEHALLAGQESGLDSQSCIRSYATYYAIAEPWEAPSLAPPTIVTFAPDERCLLGPTPDTGPRCSRDTMIAGLVASD